MEAPEKVKKWVDLIVESALTVSAAVAILMKVFGLYDISTFWVIFLVAFVFGYERVKGAFGAVISKKNPKSK